MAGKADIIDHLANEHDLTKKQASEIVDTVLDQITGCLADGDKVQMAGFGTFTVSHRAERQGRNPQTGEAMTIKASNNVRFKAAKQLKDSVN